MDRQVQVQYSLLLKLYKLQHIRNSNGGSLKYSLLLKLYKLQHNNKNRNHYPEI